MQVLGEKGVRRWAMRSHATLQGFLQEVHVLGVQCWPWSCHCHLSSQPPSHLCAITQVHTTITCHRIVTEASWLASCVYSASRQRVCHSSWSPLMSLPIWGWLQPTQKKATVLAMAFSLLFSLALPPTAHPFAPWAPAPLTSLLSPQILFTGFPSGLCTWHSLWLEYVSPGKFQPSILHTFLQMSSLGVASAPSSTSVLFFSIDFTTDIYYNSPTFFFRYCLSTLLEC